MTQPIFFAVSGENSLAPKVARFDSKLSERANPNLSHLENTVSRTIKSRSFEDVPFYFRLVTVSEKSHHPQ